MRVRGRPRLAPFCLGALLLVAGAGCDTPASGDPARDPIAAPAPVRAAQRVRVAEVRRARVGGLSDVAGVTSAFRNATVAAEVAGRVVVRHVEPGVAVEEGQPLVTLDDTLPAIAVDEARATLKARQVDLAEAKSELERGEELRRERTISERQIDSLRFSVDRAESARSLAAAALRRAERSLADTVVRAPFSGTVEQIGVQVGDYLAPGAPVATVADFERVRLRAGVTASEAADLRPGMRARVTLTALGGRESSAEIHSVARTADPESGTYPVELWLDNADGRLRAGMVGQVDLAAPDVSAAAVVPRAAVLRRDGRLAVFVVDGSGEELQARARAVRLGRQSDDRVEIVDGVRVGEQVVVDGLFALTDGAPVYVDTADTALASQGSWSD